MQLATPALPGILRAGALAGLIGAVLIDFYVLAVFCVHIGLWQLIRLAASSELGNVMFMTPIPGWLGVALHFAVSIGWGIGYASIAARMPQVHDRPLVSGIVFGFVVWIAMTLTEIAGAIWMMPSPNMLGHMLVAYTIFFGVPIAYAVSFATSAAGELRA